MNIVWAPLAEEQVAESFAYIDAERPSAAIDWFEHLVHQAGSLALLPDQGRIVPEVGRAQIREVLVSPYRVIYRHDHAEVVILSVQHERRELDLDGLDPSGSCR